MFGEADDGVWARARSRLPRGAVLAQNLAGSGAFEVSAEGSRIGLSDGRTVLDFSSYAVTLFGHRPPTVVDRVVDALHTQPTSSRTLCNPVTATAADALVQRVGADGLGHVWFGLNGSDAVEVSLKLARLVTGRSGVAAVEGGFHGKSLGALAATASPRYRDGLDTVLAPNVHIPPRAGALAEAAQSMDIAAFVFEPVQGEGGVRPIPDDVVRSWAEEARAAGIMLIADEVQVGLGRCGPLSLTLDTGVVPDALLLGKPLGGGVLPLSAMVAGDTLWRPLDRDPFVHSSTFSGHPLSCAALLGALELLDPAIERAQVLGPRFRHALDDLASTHPSVVSGVRGRGLLWGLLTPSPAAAGHLMSSLCEHGLLVSPCLGDPTVIRLLPPACLSDFEFDSAMRILHAAAQVSGQELLDSGTQDPIDAEEARAR